MGAPAVGEDADEANEEAAAEARKEAAMRFRRGSELFEQGNLRGALIELRRASELSPNWRVHFNIGQVLYELRDYPAAAEAFERYLAEGGDEVPADRRQLVAADLEKLHEHIEAQAGATDVDGPEDEEFSSEDADATEMPAVMPAEIPAPPPVAPAAAPPGCGCRVAGGATRHGLGLLAVLLMLVAPLRFIDRRG